MKDHLASSLGSLYMTLMLMEFCYEGVFFFPFFSFLYDCICVNVYVVGMDLEGSINRTVSFTTSYLPNYELDLLKMTKTLKTRQSTIFS